MIPLRLAIRNFMCYRDDVPVLDLGGIHVACVCGDNGHGKTALLDAITWVLWGKARASTQDELVHQGQQDMDVELEFLARDQRYRVSRRHSRGGRRRQGATILELQVTSDNGVRPITGNTIPETEARIREILHMDYDTFINTAYLCQGDADRFTTSGPPKRKETLAKVLDLSYYEGLEERARARSHDIRKDIQAVEGAIALRQQEIARRPEYEEQLASTKAALARITPEAEAQWLKLEELRRSVDSLQGRRRTLEELALRLPDDRREVSHLERQVAGHAARVERYEAAVQRESEIRESFARLDRSRAELARLDQALGIKSELDRQKASLEREVAVQRERLSGRVTQLHKRIAEQLEPAAKRLPEIEEGLKATAREQAKLSELEDSIQGHREEAQEVAARVRDLQLANDRLRQDMEETRKKFDMLEQGDTRCPLCKQPLGPEGQEHLRREYEALDLEGKRQHQRNTDQLKALESTHQELSTRVSQLDAELNRGRQRTESTKANLARDMAESEKAQSDSQSALAELEELTARLDAGEFAQEERHRLAQMESEVSALAYDGDAHRTTREQLKALDGYDELNRVLLEAVEGLPSEREAFETANQMLGRRGQEIQEAEEQQSTLKKELKALPSLEIQLGDAEARYQGLSDEKNAAMVRQGVLEQHIERCDQLDREVRQQEQVRRRLEDERSIYDELSVAFGKNGIQALIIESAIPQLEADANELLGRLSENRMFLRLQLQEGRRDSRSGRPSEELDIRISDEVGTRSYETFSGGEAFRINFALRIALSKLLARRSGAPLPILFIDEGFGSQDAAGQERLTQAIQSIQADFEKIIVITHIEQIKEAFPVRIEVTKTGAGATFEVV